jgi:UDP-N-acetyl-D-galactosamine dehydrogenase
MILKKDDIVIYESTVYPGVTEEICVPILEEESDLVFNKDFYCGYSPERINPGDKEHTVTKILKITSGSTPEIAKKVDELYKSIIKAGTHLAPTIKVAEAAKVIENTQRDVNIALINELAMIFDRMNINTKDVIEAAATKWNFIKLFPGLVGGHCIGVDPYYLTYKAQSLGYMPNLILGARQINNSMSKLIADKAVKYMVKNNKKLNGANVLILGVTFKENCPDMRNSKVLDIIDELKEFECNIEVFDPWVDKSDKETKHLNFLDSLPLNSNKYDSIIVAVGHEQFKTISTEDYSSMSNKEAIVIDVKGIVEKPTWRL